VGNAYVLTNTNLHCS